MKNKTGLAPIEAIVYIIIAVTVVVIGLIIFYQDNNALSGIASAIKSKLRFGI